MEKYIIPEHVVELYKFEELSQDIKDEIFKQWESFQRICENDISKETGFFTSLDDMDEEEVQDAFHEETKDKFYTINGTEYNIPKNSIKQ